MLFIDFSSAFNTIIPSRLIHKLSTLGISSTLCSCIMDFLSCRPQCVRMGEHTSPSLTLSTGCPLGIVLPPLLYTLYIHDCTTTYSSNTIIKFTDDTTVIGNITNDDEGPYREEVKLLTEWCAANNLSLNVSKTKELIIDFRKGGRTHTPLNTGGTLVERMWHAHIKDAHIERCGGGPEHNGSERYVKEYVDELLSCVLYNMGQKLWLVSGQIPQSSTASSSSQKQHVNSNGSSHGFLCLACYCYSQTERTKQRAYEKHLGKDRARNKGTGEGSGKEAETGGAKKQNKAHGHDKTETENQRKPMKTGKTGQHSTAQHRTGQDRTAQDRTGQDSTGQDRTGQDRTGQDRTGQDSTGQDRTGQDSTGQDRTGQDSTGQDRTGLHRTGQDSTAQHSTAQHRTGQDRTGQDSTAQHRTGQDRTGQDSTAQHSTAQHNTGQHRTAQDRTGQDCTAQHRTGQHSTPQHSTAQHRTAQDSTGQDRTGQHSTAQHSTGQDRTGQHRTAQHSTAQDRTGLHSTAQHRTGQHSTPQHSTAQHRTAQDSTGQDRTGQHSTAQHRTGQDRTGQHRTAQHSTAQDRTGQDCTGQDSTGQDRTGQDSTAQHSTGQDRTGQDSTGQHSTAQDRTGQDRTAQHSTAQDRTGQDRTGQHSTGQHSTAQHRTAQHSTAQHSTAQHSTGQDSTAQDSTAQHSTAQDKLVSGHLDARCSAAMVGKKKKILIASIVVICVICITVPLAVILTQSKSCPDGSFRNAAVAADSEPCSIVGRDILKSGGSAADGAIAALLCTSIIHPQSNGIGGGAIFTIRDSNGKVRIINARETVPKVFKGGLSDCSFDNADLPLRMCTYSDLFLFHEAPNAAEYGVQLRLLSRVTYKVINTGPQWIGVPGEIRGYELVHELYGKLTWAELFEPTIKLAREGVTINKTLARYLPHVEKHSAGELFRDAEGNMLKEGDTVKFEKLAETLKRIAAGGADEFYTGKTARDLISDIQEAGGNLTLEDLSSVNVSETGPWNVSLGNYTMFFPPPPSRGAQVAFILNVLEGYKPSPASLEGRERVLTYHRYIEASKFAAGLKDCMKDPRFNPQKVGYTGIFRRKKTSEGKSKMTEPMRTSTTIITKYGDNPGTTLFRFLDEDGWLCPATSTSQLPCLALESSPPKQDHHLTNMMTDFCGNQPGRATPAPSQQALSPLNTPKSNTTNTDLHHESLLLVQGTIGRNGCTTQDYLHTETVIRTTVLNDHVTVTKHCSGVVPDCHGVTQIGRGSSCSDEVPGFSLGGRRPTESVWWRHRGQHRDGRFVVTRPEDARCRLHLHRPYLTICRNWLRSVQAGMGWIITGRQLGNLYSSIPRDVWRVVV
ncbi:hypothetical protein NFI96_002538 [Prochilodus magdalenae]|nr:hypothetical protein NFI96_002538 [Prochilodus magdalenae]